MKPFLGIDLTKDKKNKKLNYYAFLVETPSADTLQYLDRSMDQADEIIEQSKMPLPLRIISYICGLFGIIAVVGILRALGSVSLATAYHNIPWVFWAGGICLIVWGLLSLIAKKKSASVMESDESTRVFSKVEGNCDTVYAELSVPSDAKTVDLLLFYYKEKNGEIKACERGMQMSPYMVVAFRAFTDSDTLYLADLDGKYAFPLSSFTALRKVKKHIRICGWNKDENISDGIFKEFKLTCDNYGCIHCKSYSVLEVNREGEKWGIYIPCYETPIFEKLTGLKAREE